MTVPVLDRHIEVDPAILGGKLYLKGHRITVENIVTWHGRMGKSADEIAADEIASEYNLTLAEIYAALSYYFDHQGEVVESIRESKAFVREMQIDAL